MKKNSNLNMNNLDYFNLVLSEKETRILLIVVIILVIILLFRKQFNTIVERIIVFGIIFLLFLLITKNLVATFIGSCIIFLLINLIIRYRNTIENFEALKDESTKFDSHANSEPAFDKNIFDTDEFKKSSDGIQDLLKKMNGGIELKDDDVKDTGILNIDTKKYSDEEIPNPLKIAQKETYELINTVSALHDTIKTLSPVLQEGKKLMNIFENLKL
jgi:predicted membrane protein